MNKMAQSLTMIALIFLMISLASSQTFQYSHGWEPGKRSMDSFPIASHLQARCNSFNKWSMLIQSNNNDEICRVPCEFLDVLHQWFCQDSNKADLALNNYIGRLPAP